MNTEITDVEEIRDTKSEARKKAELRNPSKGASCGWVFYDASCPFCTQWARRSERSLNERGFGVVALQSHGIAERLAVEPEKLLAEMRVLTTDGRVLGGADGAVELGRHYWWAWPVVWFSKLPGAMELLRVGYRWVAAHRTCLSHCPNSLRHPRPMPGSWSLPVLNWVPLVALPAGAMLTRNILPAWIFMWVFASAIFFGCKWLTWRRACRSGSHPTFARSLGYLFAWPGMDAPNFQTSGKKVGSVNLKFSSSLEVGAWGFATAKTLAGAGLIWLAVNNTLRLGPLGAGWLAMIGIVLFLHFGVFDLLAVAWQRAGVSAMPVMRAPLRATSLADFWSRRWNTAFHTLAHELIFRPVARRLGVVRGTVAVFVISGLVHEAVISFPARGGYGLPTAYFVLQAFGVLAERSAVGCWLKLGNGARGWLYVMIFTAGPVFWLFHPAFIKNVILPMLRAFGAS